MPIISISGRTGVNIETLKSEIKKLAGTEISANSSFFKLNDGDQNTVEEIQQQLSISNPYKAKLIAHHHARFRSLNNEEKKLVAAICQENGFKDLQSQIAETMQRYEKFVPMLRSALTKQVDQSSFTDKIDAVLTHKIFAPIIFFAIMFFVFQAIYAWAAYPMDWIEEGFALTGEFAKNNLPSGWWTDLLTDGILAGLGGILVFIPQIAILFFLISILEEAGYMARAVFIFDKLMQQFGLNGRSVVALVSGGHVPSQQLCLRGLLGIGKNDLSLLW